MTAWTVGPSPVALAQLAALLEVGDWQPGRRGWAHRPARRARAAQDCGDDERRHQRRKGARGVGARRRRQGPRGEPARDSLDVHDCVEEHRSARRRPKVGRAGREQPHQDKAPRGGGGGHPARGARRRELLTQACAQQETAFYDHLMARSALRKAMGESPMEKP